MPRRSFSLGHRPKPGQGLRCAPALALAALALGIVACVDIPDNMRAQFAPAGPNERTNYVPGRHGSAPPDTPAPLLPWDAGAVDTPAAADAGPAVTPPPMDGGSV